MAPSEKLLEAEENVEVDSHENEIRTPIQCSVLSYVLRFYFFVFGFVVCVCCVLCFVIFYVFSFVD